MNTLEIGEPRRIVESDPIEDPVPREQPAPKEPVEVPSEDPLVPA